MENLVYYKPMVGQEIQVFSHYDDFMDDKYKRYLIQVLTEFPTLFHFYKALSIMDCASEEEWLAATQELRIELLAGSEGPFAAAIAKFPNFTAKYRFLIMAGIMENKNISLELKKRMLKMLFS